MSSGVKDLLRRRNNPGYLNWLAVRHGLLFLNEGLQKYAENKMKELHSIITTNVGGPGVKCTCKFTLGKKPNPHGQATTTCIWAQELKKFHVFSRKSDIPWHQSNSCQWDDPVHGYWEIAKLFMSDLGKNCATTKDPSTTDIGPLLNLLIFCKHFKVQQASLQAVKDWRNKWAHASNLTFSDIEKQNAFKDIDQLINDPELVGIKEVQDCCPFVKKVETADISVLEEKELQIIHEFRLIEENKQSHVTKEELGKPEDETRTLKEDQNSDVTVDKSNLFLLALLSFATSPIFRKFPGIVWSLMAFFLFSRVGDRTVISDYGCPVAVTKSPISHLHFQEFDFSSYLAYKREGFVGRKWFFLELESFFEENNSTTGILITGEPGSVLDYFLQTFSTVDVLDSNNKTPAFYAASEGLVRSLQSCIQNGADISSFLEGYEELDPVSVVVRNAGIEEFSLMHVHS